MSQTIQIPNFSRLNIVEESQLDADEAAGQTTLTVRFSDNLAANDYILIGTPGSESAELAVVQSVTNASTIVIASATTKDHSRYEKVTKLFGNQIQIYRAANVDGSQPDDDDFSAHGSPFDIDIDQVQTTYTDATGSDSYWYKFVYYNETSANSTSLTDSFAARGGGAGNYTSIESIRREAGLLNNKYISDAFVDEKRQAAQAFINSTLSGVYTVPFTAPINPLIAEITRLLAAGYLLTDNYGPLGTLNTNEGEQKIKRVTNSDKTGLLDRLNTKDLVLTDQSGASTAIAGTGASFGGWPDGTTATADTDDGGSERAIRMGMEF